MEALIQVSNIFQGMSMFSDPGRIFIPNFRFLQWVFRYKKPSCHLFSGFGLWRILEFPDRACKIWFRYEYDQLPKKILCTQFQVPTLSFKVQRTLRSLLSRLGLWRMLEVPDWGLESSLRYRYVQLPRKNLYAIFQLPTLSFQMQRILMSFLSWLGLWGMMGVLNLHQGLNMLSYPRRILVPNFGFLNWVLRCKELSYPTCLDWGCRGCWMFLIGDWSVHHGISLFSYPRRISVPNISFLHWVLRCKEVLCPYCLDLGCQGNWRFLIGVWNLHQGINMFSYKRRISTKFQLPRFIFKVQRSLMSL